jgi:hypothetical protein
VRNWSTFGALKGKLAALCDHIVETYDRNVVLIAMQTPHDIFVSYDVARLMKNKAYILDTRYTAEQIMGIVGRADFVLSMRLHTLIFSARMCVPLIGWIMTRRWPRTLKRSKCHRPVRSRTLTWKRPAPQSGPHGGPGKICGAPAAPFRGIRSNGPEDAQQLLDLLKSPKKERRHK